MCGAGDPLGVCELMLGYPRTAELTADSMVQCLMVPTATFQHLVETMPGVYTRAWQATAAQLAAQHHHILGNHKQLAPLNMFFRLAAIARSSSTYECSSSLVSALVACITRRW
jgi:CRP-like cAMP-binding protein